MQKIAAQTAHDARVRERAKKKRKVERQRQKREKIERKCSWQKPKTMETSFVENY